MIALRSFLVAAVALALPAGAAMAGDEVLVSAAHPAQPVASVAAPAKPVSTDEATKPVMTQAQTIAWLANAPKVDHPAPDAAPAAQDNKAQSLVHGSAGVSIGTGGYRSAYATAVMPVGDNGMLGIAVSQTNYGNNARPYGYGYGGYGYDGYGYNGYGRGYGYGRGGTSSSLALSYRMENEANGRSDTPAGCAPGFRDGEGRYMEPLWVTRMNGDHDCKASDGQP